MLTIPSHTLYPNETFIPIASWEFFEPFEQCNFSKQEVAEQAPDLIQPYPCAIMQRSDNGKFMVARKKSGEFTFIFGGHIEIEDIAPLRRLSLPPAQSCAAVVIKALTRILSKKFNLADRGAGDARVAGYIYDMSTADMTRHVALLHWISLRKIPHILTDDYDKNFGVSYMSLQDLNGMLKYMDAWSKRLLESNVLRMVDVSQ